MKFWILSCALFFKCLFLNSAQSWFYVAFCSPKMLSHAGLRIDRQSAVFWSFYPAGSCVKCLPVGHITTLSLSSLPIWLGQIPTRDRLGTSTLCPCENRALTLLAVFLVPRSSASLQGLGHFGDKYSAAAGLPELENKIPPKLSLLRKKIVLSKFALNLCHVFVSRFYLWMQRLDLSIFVPRSIMIPSDTKAMLTLFPYLYCTPVNAWNLQHKSGWLVLLIYATSYAWYEYDPISTAGPSVYFVYLCSL